MSLIETADHHNVVAGDDAAATFHASHASDVHVSTITDTLSDGSTKPTKYDKTAVILLGWKPEYCDTGVAPELEGLQKVFQERYNFPVELNLMDTVSFPQVQAFKHLSNFVHVHDAPRTLLIIYYAGHGVRFPKGTDHISLSGKPYYHDEDKLTNSFEWHEVERTLVRTASDVLVVFDCCCAGLLCKSAREGLGSNARIYQFLGACESDQQTESSGDSSFTAAFTWALERLAVESSFPVTKLVKEIEMHKSFPHGDQRPVLFGGRFAAASEIVCLSRMPSSTSLRKASVVANIATENMTGDGSIPGASLLWTFPGARIMQSAAMLSSLLRRRILGHDAVTYIANCSLKRAVTQRWNDFLRTAGRTSHTADHLRDAGRSRSDVQNDCS